MADSEDNSGLIGNLLGNLVPIIVVLVVMALGGGAGFAVATLMLPSPPPAETDQDQTGETAQLAQDQEDLAGTENLKDTPVDFTYFEFEPILVNLNDPRQARYMQTTIHLGINTEVFPEASATIERMMPDLKDWLIVHLSGCRIEDVAGDINKTRLKLRILNAFNDMLWPKSKPLIDKIVFVESTIR